MSDPPFGSSVITPEELVRELASELSAAETLRPLPTSGSDFQNRSRTAFTSQFFRILVTMGQRHSMRVCRAETKNPSIRDDPEREFLWDVVWLAADGRLLLAFESEWSGVGERVLYDFQKLLYAKCPLKVLAYAEQTRTADVLERVREILRSYPVHVEGEKYVVIRFGHWKAPRLECTVFEVMPGCVVVESVLEPKPLMVV